MEGRRDDNERRDDRFLDGPFSRQVSLSHRSFRNMKIPSHRIAQHHRQAAITRSLISSGRDKILRRLLYRSGSYKRENNVRVYTLIFSRVFIYFKARDVKANPANFITIFSSAQYNISYVRNTYRYKIGILILLGRPFLEVGPTAVYPRS